VIELCNDHMRVVIAPEVGGEVQFLGRPNGPNVLAWYDWRTPLPANCSRTYGSSLLDWCSEYRGGWQELFPNAGEECEVDTIPLPYHGEVSRTAWRVEKQSAHGATLSVGARLPLVLERRMSLRTDAPVLLVEESVSNESSATVPFVWVHHPAFAAEPGSKIDLPPSKIHVDSNYWTELGDLKPGGDAEWPFAPSKQGGQVDLSIIPEGPTDRMCYAVSLERAWAAVRGQSSGVALAWNAESHPYAWLWTEIGVPVMPSYGRSRIVAIEPASYWPADGLAEATKSGRALTLNAGESLTTWLTMVLIEGGERAVDGVDPDGTVHWQSERTMR
jgi:galactose mutarotase-like enzyme